MEIKAQLFVLLDVLIAFILTGLIGYERELANKPAGFRTNMIIGGAAALLVSLGKIMVLYYENENLTRLNVDPVRIIEAIIVGISFIGAGTILKSESEEKVQYLTTAATILFSAGIGISVALKSYFLAVGLTLLILIINYFVRKNIKIESAKDKQDLIN